MKTISIYAIEFLTPEQLAHALQIDPKTVINEIKRGNLSAVKVGKQYRISQEAFRHYIGKQGV